MPQLIHVPHPEEPTPKGLTPAQKATLIRFVRLVEAEVDRQGGCFEFSHYEEFMEAYLALQEIPLH
jgi:hypothetical protein